MRPFLLIIVAYVALAYTLLVLLMLPVIRYALRYLANQSAQRFYRWRLGYIAHKLRAQMVAATAVQILDRPGGFHFQVNFNLNPGSIAAGGREVETIAVPGIQVGDGAIVCPQYATSLVVGYATCRQAGTLEFSLENNTAGAIDEAASNWVAFIFRGTTGPLR